MSLRCAIVVPVYECQIWPLQHTKAAFLGRILHHAFHDNGVRLQIIHTVSKDTFLHVKEDHSLGGLEKS